MRIGVVICLLLWSFTIHSQTRVLENDYNKHHQVGFNVSELINLFIPFKGRVASGPFGAVWRSGRNDKYFNFQVGARIRGDNDDFGNIQIGYLRKKPLNGKFSYYRSVNLILTGGGFNLPSVENDNDGGFGLSFGGGFEYTLAKNVSISTEALFVLAAGSFDGVIHIIPPVGIFLLGKF